LLVVLLSKESFEEAREKIKEELYSKNLAIPANNAFSSSAVAKG
jgi:hypothetical protein